MKFDRSNKFDLCYYGQVNSVRLKLNVPSKWASKHLWGVTFILLAMVHRLINVYYRLTIIVDNETIRKIILIYSIFLQ